MNKETIAAETGMVCEPVEKTNLFDKLISNDQLSYLPNLYLRQYRFIDELIHLRQDFPEQKLLVERSRTKRDVLLEDAIFASRIFQEVPNIRVQRRKLKIATTSNLARQLRLEVQRGQLRSQEQYHFHRLTSTYLADAVLDTFRKATEPIPVIEQQEQPQERQQGPKKNQDDIFMNEEEYNYPLQEPDDLLDDLLAVDGGEAPHISLDQAASLQVEPLSVYLSSKYAERKKAIDSEPEVSISRKATLKRINENVRKRLKYKEEQEQQVGRSLSSATVFLSNLLNLEPEAKATILNEPLNTSEWLFVGEKPRKKKEEDSIDLRWPQEQLQKMQQRNEKNGLKKGKLDSGVLMLTLPQNEDEYRKAFEKQITGDKSFPPTLRNVVEAQPERRPKYYNEFHDKEYEMFVTKYNKKKLFQKFSEKAPMIFPENYSQDDIEDAENISTGRLFIYKPEKMLKRVVFLKEQRAVKTYLRSEPKNSVDQPRALLLAFLVQRYLKEFGNNWKNIAQLICRHIAFAHKHVTVQFVQQIYQMVQRLSDKGSSIPSLQLWDKKILPFSCNNTQSYTSYHPDQHGIKAMPNGVIPLEQKQISKSQDCPITSDYYKKLVANQVEEIEESPYQSYEEQFQQFIKPLKDNLQKLNTKGGEGETQIDKISKILEMYVQSGDQVAYETEDQYPNESSSSSRHQILTENLKGEIKVGTPYRKKKSINQRNNQLVKILQALRNKTVPNPVNPLQKKPEDTKPNGQLPPQKINSIASSAPPVQKPAAETAPSNADPKKNMKSPEKPDKKLGAPSKKQKKSRDGDEKKQK